MPIRQSDVTVCQFWNVFQSHHPIASVPSYRIQFQWAHVGEKNMCSYNYCTSNHGSGKSGPTAKVSEISFRYSLKSLFSTCLIFCTFLYCISLWCTMVTQQSTPWSRTWTGSGGRKLVDTSWRCTLCTSTHCTAHSTSLPSVKLGAGRQ